MPADLHTHSTASDGTLSPAQVVHAAAEVGLTVVALTDHDTFAGVAAAVEAGERLGVEVLGGAELSCRTASGISLHVLSYWADPGNDALAQEMTLSRDDRVPRTQEMLRRLAADGYDVSFADLLALAGPGVATLGRPHVAELLVARGYAESVDDAFARILGGRSPYYVPHHGTEPVRAVGLVRAAGGAAVLAHPFAGRRGPVVTDDDVAALAAAGLAGIEVDHPEQDRGQRAHAARLAAELDLVPLGSSDFHGTRKPQRIGACRTPTERLEALRARRAPEADGTRA